MEACIFCKIIAGDIPSAAVYEDEHVFAFLDINPTNPGHTLVVPRGHYENLFDISEDALCAVVAAAKKIAPAICSSVDADAINLIQNNGRAAGQLVFHSHLHVIPRFANDGYRHWKGKPYKEGEMETIQKKIQSTLGT